ncbi:unnamed protein product [Leptidea sinapis]|uniref:Uncharacterized protein n=1 Tax=Leptidea sinapis TaxID=189913 RepID=A0A5E4QKD8_9NEOP|nr:unnamed protein product [Leptidea sinapis]
MDSELLAEKNETSDRGVVHVDCFVSTQEQRPIENGTANVFLTSALTPGSPHIPTNERMSTLHHAVKI